MYTGCGRAAKRPTPEMCFLLYACVGQVGILLSHAADIHVGPIYKFINLIGLHLYSSEILIDIQYTYTINKIKSTHGSNQIADFTAPLTRHRLVSRNGTKSQS